jgi:MOSC domain-containing protein YiiM
MAKHKPGVIANHATADLAAVSGIIIAIFVAPAKHAAQVRVESVQLKSGRGIVGDRFFGFRPKQKGRNLTLLEAEVIAEFNQNYRQTIPLDATRRNVITHGIRLNDLVGKTFKLGGVLCRGIELCEPCKVIARSFPEAGLLEREIIHAFTNKGGIRAEVLADGVIDVGQSIQITLN